MTKNINHVSHIKSKQTVNGKPKLPNPSSLVEGEIAINFAEGVETLSIKNESGNVITFSSDNFYTEQKLGSGFTGENSGRTVTEAIEDSKVTVDQVIDETTSASTNPVSTKAVYDKLVEDEETWAISLNQLNNEKFGYANFDDTNNTIEFYKDSDEATSGSPISSLDLSSFSIDIDQVIDSGTSASTDAVSTSAVYGFVTSYTPSITVDQVLDNTTSASTNPVSSKAAYKAITDNELVWTNAFVSLSGEVSSHTENTDIHVTTSDKTNWNSKLDSSDIVDFFDDARYEDSGATKVINFYHGNTIKATIDASSFLVDGMVDSVVVTSMTSGSSEVQVLRITWNSAAGKEVTNIPLTDIFDPSLYYTKTEIDDAEQVTAQAINDLNARVDAVSGNSHSHTNKDVLDGITAQKVSNWDAAYTSAHIHTNQSVLDNITSQNVSDWNTVTAKTDTTAFTAHISDSGLTTIHHTHDNIQYLSGISGDVGTMAYEDASDYYTKEEIDEGDRVISQSLNDLNARVIANTDSISGLTESSHTHSNKSALDSITGNVGTMAYETASSYSSATQVNTALGSKTDTTAFTAHTSDTTMHMNSTEKTNLDSLATNIAAISGITAQKVTNWDSLSSNIEELSGETETISAALVELNVNKLDTTAYTPVDTSMYYRKSETSSKTEIEDAFSVVNGLSTNLNELSGQTETISAALVDLNTNKLDTTAYTPPLESFIEPLTWSELKAKRDNGTLFVGGYYRITDYVCTTTQANTSAATHQFDIIVRADDTDVLNENAYAIQHSGDTYFSASTLEAWELKYCIDNDKTRFAWADDANGKGVIYYMKDEFENECPYDFKNIMFERWWGNEIETTSQTATEDMTTAMKDMFVSHYHSYSSSDLTLGNSGLVIKIDSKNSKFFYTFSLCSEDGETFESDDNETVYDGSLKHYGDNMYTNNVIKEYLPIDVSNIIHKLNNIVFKPINSGADDCGNNVFGKNCYDMTIGFSWTFNNSFGNDCYNNSFGNNCGRNTFGNECDDSTFGNNCYCNTFGNECGGNTFGKECVNNTFVNNCYYNTFGNWCVNNTFGNGCHYNTFVNNCYYNTFGNGCNNITFAKDYMYYNIVENGNQYITVTSTQTTSLSNVIRNFTIAQGVNNTSRLKTISHNTTKDTFKTTYQNSESETVDV